MPSTSHRVAHHSRPALDCDRCSCTSANDGCHSTRRCSGAVVALIAPLTLALVIALPSRAATINLPDITVHSLAHTYEFGPGSEGDIGTATDRINALGTVNSGSFSKSAPTYFGYATAGDTISQRFLAPSGHKFSVDYNANFARQTLQVNFLWSAGTGTLSSPRTPQVTFENLVGTAPVMSVGQAYLTTAGNRLAANVVMDVTSDFSFSEMRISWTPINTPTSLADRTFILSSPADIMFGTKAIADDVDYNAVTMAITPVPEPASGALAVGGLLLAATSLARRRARNVDSARP